MHFDSDHSDQVSGAIYFAYPAIGDIKVHRCGKRKVGNGMGHGIVLQFGLRNGNTNVVLTNKRKYIYIY